MIFFKYSDAITDIQDRIDMAVFPTFPEGPQNHQIGGLAAPLLEVMTPEFVEYSKAVVSSSKTVADASMPTSLKVRAAKLGFQIVLAVSFFGKGFRPPSAVSFAYFLPPSAAVL